MKRLLLAGGGQAHALVLREFAHRRAEDATIVLVTPASHLRYSGMLPGWIAGHYALDELTVDIEPLARAAGARVVAANVTGLDLAHKTVVTDRDERIDFDVLSLATGALIDVDAIEGARMHALPVRPFDHFVAGWQKLVQRAEHAGAPFQLTVIGGGAAGAEIALAMAYRGRSTRAPIHVQLLTGGAPLLPGHGARARALIGTALQMNGVRVLDDIAQRIDPAAVVTTGKRQLSTDTTVIATGAAASAWLRGTGLALDDRGFIAVNSHLQSTSHPFVFAAGDTAALMHTPRPKSGVYAVRAAPHLTHNLLAALAGNTLSAFSPQPSALYLITTGPKHAVASWGSSAWAGQWVWHWKNRIDHDYIAKLRHS